MWCQVAVLGDGVFQSADILIRDTCNDELNVGVDEEQKHISVPLQEQG